MDFSSLQLLQSTAAARARFHTYSLYSLKSTRDTAEEKFVHLGKLWNLELDPENVQNIQWEAICWSLTG